jgi:hypothetical protein
MPITEPVPTVEPTPIAVGIPSRERPATIGPTPPPEPERRRSWAVLAIALTAQTLVVLDISVVNTALPTIGHALRLGNADLQWLVTAYLLMSGGGLLLGGRISDLLPRRRVFLTGLTAFHPRFAVQRLRRHRHRAHRRPRHPGPGRSPDDTGRAVHRDDDLLLRRTPPALLRVLGLWNPTVRSLLEMQYQFEEPFVVDSAKITDRLGLRATPLDRALDETATEHERTSRR